MQKLPAFLFLLLSWAFAASAWCAEIVIKYRADEKGRLHETGRYLAEWGTIGRRPSYEVNGIVFTYDLSPLHGSIHGPQMPPARLAIGKYLTPFSCGTDAPPFGAGKSWFSGVIRPIADRKLTVADLPAEAGPGGLAEYMFFPKGKPGTKEFRVVNGRKWLVVTKFDDAAATMVEGRCFWAVEDGFLLTFNIHFTSAPTDERWRQQRLQVLDKLVSAFRMQRKS